MAQTYQITALHQLSSSWVDLELYQEQTDCTLKVKANKAMCADFAVGQFVQCQIAVLGVMTNASGERFSVKGPAKVNDEMMAAVVDEDDLGFFVPKSVVANDIAKLEKEVMFAHTIYLSNVAYQLLSVSQVVAAPNKIHHQAKIPPQTKPQQPNAAQLNHLGEQANYASDFKTAAKYYEQAAKLGDGRAMANRGFLAEYGRLGIRDCEQAFYWYSKAALVDDAVGYYKVGDAYHWGNFVTKDEQLAWQNYQKAYERIWHTHEQSLVSDIYWRLALCYAEGCGVKKDLLKAYQHACTAYAAALGDQVYKKYMWQSILRRTTKLKTELEEKLAASYDLTFGKEWQ